MVYHAFVTSDGALKDFKLIQSTGHRNLDEKTLAALRIMEVLSWPTRLGRDSSNFKIKAK